MLDRKTNLMVGSNFYGFFTVFYRLFKKKMFKYIQLEYEIT